MEEDHQHELDRHLLEKEAYMDEMEEMLDTILCSQPGFNLDELFTPVLTQMVYDSYSVEIS